MMIHKVCMLKKVIPELIIKVNIKFY